MNVIATAKTIAARTRRLGRAAQKVFEQVQYDFALSCRTVFYGMAIAMAIAFVVALVAMPRGV